MFKVLFLLFIIVPIIEISLLIQVGNWLGVWPTIAIVIITAWLGAKYVKQQGISTMQSVQTKMAQGEMPSDEIVAGLLLLVAGIVLVTPGFVTDLIGLSLLVPSIRKALIKSVQKHMSVQNVSSSSFVYQQHSEFHTQQSSPFEQNIEQTKQAKGETLEGEFERKD